jgi:hypothetical protein
MHELLGRSDDLEVNVVIGPENAVNAVNVHWMSLDLRACMCEDAFSPGEQEDKL